MTTYSESGVDIDAGEALVEHIKKLNPSIGGFAGLYSLQNLLKRMRNPTLVSSTDGVGTKLLLAIEANRLGDIGQDLVAMCVNDIITTGAEPLFFLDTFSTGKLNIEQAKIVVDSIDKACRTINCPLLGGETAEMPGLYAEGQFDLVGFTVGAADQHRLIDGSTIKEGYDIIGLPSSGLHSNGYSLARNILKGINLASDDFFIGDKSILEILLRPTTLYVNQVMQLIKYYPIAGMAHITGGGIYNNTKRVIPTGLDIDIDYSSWPEPKEFDILRKAGEVQESEMRKVFNLGIGYVIISDPNYSQHILDELDILDTLGLFIGKIIKE